ncbi:MAG TPA: hypothetical protein VMT28_17950 [Terriglobales bacterium]|jgi:hypothetical protein|nr:hypothetical protein [Terriglobales bacterium]
MSEVVHNAQHEFWRPPAAQPSAAGSNLVEVCDSCGTEFMVGAHFCHACGATRQALPNRGWTRYLEFHSIKQGLGLSTASLVAFLLGLACALAALACGFIYSERNVLEWQAVQIYRVQWLLAAVAAFVGGLLLRKRPGPEK